MLPLTGQPELGLTPKQGLTAMQESIGEQGLLALVQIWERLRFCAVQPDATHALMWATVRLGTMMRPGPPWKEARSVVKSAQLHLAGSAAEGTQLVWLQLTCAAGPRPCRHHPCGPIPEPPANQAALSLWINSSGVATAKVPPN